MYKESIVRIYHNDTFRGTGFFINSDGIFLTARHCIPTPSQLSNFKIQLDDGTILKFKHIDGAHYNEKSIDILAFQAILKKYTINNFISLKDTTNLQLLAGQCTVLGYLNSTDFKNPTVSINNIDCSSGSAELSSSVMLTAGMSGSPTFFIDTNGQPKYLLGVYTGIENNSHKMLCTSLLQKLNILENFTYKCLYSHKNAKKNFKKETNLLSFFEEQHNFEHTYLELERKLLNDLNVDPDDVQILFGRLLIHIREMFSQFVNNVSVHVKVAYQRNDDNAKVLKTLPRARNSIERGQGSTQRKNNETFNLYNFFDIHQLKSQNENFNNRINSAYCEIFCDPSKFFLCNDLKSATSNGYYYSSSDNYDTFYNSVVIFPLIDRYSTTQQFRGLLILDSPKTSCFDFNFSKEIGGTLAHRINNILKLLLQKLDKQNINISNLKDLNLD